MEYWDYDDYNGSLEDAIQKLNERGEYIQCVTILKYAEGIHESKQKVLFPIKALIIYK